MKTLLYVIGAIVAIIVLMSVVGHATAFLFHWGIVIFGVVLLAYVIKQVFGKSSK